MKREANIIKGTNSKALRTLATIVSYLLHPIFMPVVMTLVIFNLSATSFLGFGEKNLGMWLLIVAINTVFFPLVLVLLLKKLGLITSIHMHDQKDRIIPLIGSMIFYFWAYHVFNNIDSPLILRVLLLGSFLGIILTFLCSIFFKISMHTMAAGGMLGILIVLLIMSPVQMAIPLFTGIVIAGLSGTSRLLLGAHTQFEIWTGYVLGILVMLVAYWYLL